MNTSTVIRYLCSFLCMATGMVVIYFSASTSFFGYELAFPNIPFSGILGIVIAISSFLTGAAIPFLRNSDDAKVVWITLGFCAFVSLADAYGNQLGTVGEVEVKAQEAEEHNAAFETASAALPGVRDDIQTAKEELAVVRKALVSSEDKDLKAAQILLTAKGLYKGNIDGIVGPKTKAALQEFGDNLRTTLEVKEKEEQEYMDVTNKGTVPVPSAAKSIGAYFQAIFLTLVPLGMAFVSSSLVRAGDVDELEAMEEQLGALDSEVSQTLRDLLGDDEEVVAFLDDFRKQG